MKEDGKSTELSRAESQGSWKNKLLVAANFIIRDICYYGGTSVLKPIRGSARLTTEQAEMLTGWRSKLYLVSETISRGGLNFIKKPPKHQ